LPERIPAGLGSAGGTFLCARFFFAREKEMGSVLGDDLF